MSVSRSTILLAMVILVLSASGCDPGYKYDHVDTKGERLPQWSETVEGVRFSARPYRTLIGESSASINLDITNESNQVVVVLGGQLLTNGLKIEAIMIDEPLERASKTVHAGQSKLVSLYWEFGGMASEILGRDITWVWRVRIGEDEHFLCMPMQRRQW